MIFVESGDPPPIDVSLRSTKLGPFVAADSTNLFVGQAWVIPQDIKTLNVKIIIITSFAPLTAPFHG